MPFESVQPGDVITSNLMNQVFTTIADLERRVADLESGGGASGVSVTGFQPLNRRVNQTLTIEGSGFATTATDNTITIDGAPVPSANIIGTGSGTGTLVFLIPDIGTVPSGGRDVLIGVSNSDGSAERLYRVFPAATTEVRIDSVVGESPDAVRMGGTATITGAGFSADPAENRVQLILTLGGGATQTLPSPGGSFTVDTAATDTLEVSFDPVAGLTGPVISNVQLVATTGGVESLPHLVTLLVT